MTLSNGKPLAEPKREILSVVAVYRIGLLCEESRTENYNGDTHIPTEPSYDSRGLS